MQINLSVQTENFDLVDATSNEWLERMETLGDERGYFEPLGSDHSAILTDEGPILVVTFETLGSIRDTSPLHEPFGWSLVQQNGWSNLCILAHEDSWFRDPSVYGYFDRLVEDGFFEEFHKVIFYGVGMCGYAAAAYSVVAPDVTVIAVQPQATLDPDLSAFDSRFPQAATREFNDRFAYAPDMVEMAQDVFILLDPEIPEDCKHADLFRGDHIHRIHCRKFGTKLGEALVAMGVTHAMIEKAGADMLTRQGCYQALRARHRYMPYLRDLLGRVQKRGNPLLIKWLTTAVTTNTHAPRFERALLRANERLGLSTEPNADD